MTIAVDWDVKQLNKLTKEPYTVKPVYNMPLSKQPKIGFQDHLSLNAGKKRGAFCSTFDLH